MPRTCTVCLSSSRNAIDEALLNGEPYRRIAQRFAASPDAVNRHRAHVPERMAKAREAEEIADVDGLTAKLKAIEAEARRLGKKAESDGDLRTALMAVRELVRLTELAAKISGELRPSSVNVNINTKPISSEERDYLLMTVMTMRYLDDPAGFLGGIRTLAVRYGEITLAELEARERLPPLLEATTGGNDACS